MKNASLTFTRTLGMVVLCSTLVLVGCGGGGGGKKKSTSATTTVNPGVPGGSLVDDGPDGAGTPPALLGSVDGTDDLDLEILAGDNTDPSQTAATPEPGTAVLAIMGGLGLLGVATTRRKRRGELA